VSPSQSRPFSTPHDYSLLLPPPLCFSIYLPSSTRRIRPSVARTLAFDLFPLRPFGLITTAACVNSVTQPFIRSISRLPSTFSSSSSPSWPPHINAYFFYRHPCASSPLVSHLAFVSVAQSSYQAFQRSSRLHAPPLRLLPAPDRECRPFSSQSRQPSHIRKHPSISVCDPTT